MQLFICDFQQEREGIVVLHNQPALINQLKKVLRAKLGYEFYIQKKNAERRYRVRLLDWDTENITVEVRETLLPPSQKKKLWMLIALPNKFDKLELIVQKLAEIGIDEIFLRSSERSLTYPITEHKLQRLHKILQEATEQSWNRNMPTLTLIEDIRDLHQHWHFVIFDLKKEEHWTTKWLNSPLLGVIGSEGGLTSADYQHFPENFSICSLGTSVLRMETAAIIGAWQLKNLPLYSC